MKPLLLATNNSGKITEFKHGLKNTIWKIITPQDINLNTFDIPETGLTFSANAILKAKAYAHKSNLITLADDSGLMVTVLDGRPGVYSHRYGSTDLARNQKLLTEMQDKTNRTAYYECIIAIYDPRTHSLSTCRGRTNGTILDQPIGSHGFGYDPIFYSLDLKKSFGQATTSEKNQVSHRGRALVKVKQILAKWK